MSIRGSNFENQHPFASDHALVWERCMPDGLLYGVDMSFTSTLFTLGPGFMLVAGRMFEITAAESISISPGSGYARVYVAIDTGGTATETSFDQVSFGVDYAANLDSFAELTQGEININQGAAVYQAEVAVLEINSSGVTAIERQMELVSPGAGTGAFAAIAVTYPAGSTVTVSDGKITYTAPNTSGGALFIIPYAATWTVTATDGAKSASKTVEITSEGQSVSVELSFARYLIKDGQLQVEFATTGAKWNQHIVTAQAFTTAAYDATTERFVLALPKKTSWISNTYQAVDQIDTSLYSKMYIIFESETTAPADSTYVSFFANEGTAPTYIENATATLDLAAPHALAQESFEIPSAANVSIGICLRVLDGSMTAKIKDMWIE